MISFLHQPGRHDPANFRVEVVSTARHYESYYLTRGEGEAIPRGWYRQNDFPTNGVLYDRTLSAGAYQRWLRLMGVRYVFLPVHAQLDPSAKAEAALLRSGRSGLREISISKNFRAFELPDATPMLTLDAARAGRARARGRPRACCARRASSSGSRCRRPARTCCASTTRPTGASTIPRQPASSPGRTG